MGRCRPDTSRGNFDFAAFDPVPVGSYPAGASAWGVHDLVGNGWEWTSTVFGPFAGFAPMASYPEYSADFFDGQHYVMKGASPATARGAGAPQLPQLVPAATTRTSTRSSGRRGSERPTRLRRQPCQNLVDQLTLEFAADVRRDLALAPKQLQSKYLYDALGSSLFEAICRLPWYRITRAERRLLERHAPAIVALLCGPDERSCR